MIEDAFLLGLGLTISPYVLVSLWSVAKRALHASIN